MSRQPRTRPGCLEYQGGGLQGNGYCRRAHAAPLVRTTAAAPVCAVSPALLTQDPASPRKSLALPYDGVISGHSKGVSRLVCTGEALVWNATSS